jgi:hypothetical protein
MRDDTTAAQRIAARAEQIVAGWRAEGRARETVLAEFCAALGAEAGPADDRDWPVEIIRDHYMDGLE